MSEYFLGALSPTRVSHFVSSLDAQAELLCAALKSEFRLHEPLVSIPEVAAAHVTVGIEIEVPFSAYFPELWRRHGLDHRGFHAMTPQEKALFEAEVVLTERDVLSRLNKTIGMGIPRGADRYWEFAFHPVHSVSKLARQVSLLRQAGLMPIGDKPLSLHVNIGGLKASREVYLLAFLLELDGMSSQRIDQVIQAPESMQRRSWAGKGRSGLLEKGPLEMSHGAAQGVEIRTLEFNGDQAAFERILLKASLIGSAIRMKQQGTSNILTYNWGLLKAEILTAMHEHGLEDVNWSIDLGGCYRPNPEMWARFSQALPSLRQQIDGHVHWEHLALKAAQHLGGVDDAEVDDDEDIDPEMQVPTRH